MRRPARPVHRAHPAPHCLESIIESYADTTTRSSLSHRASGPDSCRTSRGSLAARSSQVRRIATPRLQLREVAPDRLPKSQGQDLTKVHGPPWPLVLPCRQLAMLGFTYPRRADHSGCGLQATMFASLVPASTLCPGVAPILGGLPDGVVQVHDKAPSVSPEPAELEVNCLPLRDSDLVGSPGLDRVILVCLPTLATEDPNICTCSTWGLDQCMPSAGKPILNNVLRDDTTLALLQVEPPIVKAERRSPSHIRRSSGNVKVIELKIHSGMRKSGMCECICSTFPESIPFKFVYCPGRECEYA